MTSRILGEWSSLPQVFVPYRFASAGRKTEHFSIERRRAKPKKSPQPIVRKKNTLKSQWELKVRVTKPPKARESAGDQVAVGFSFASYWLRGWCNFSGLITKRSKEKPMQSRITFDTRLKIVLLSEWWKKATCSLLVLSWCIRQNIKCALSLFIMSE